MRKEDTFARHRKVIHQCRKQTHITNIDSQALPREWKHLIQAPLELRAYLKDTPQLLDGGGLCAQTLSSGWLFILNRSVFPTAQQEPWLDTLYRVTVSPRRASGIRHKATLRGCRFLHMTINCVNKVHLQTTEKGNTVPKLSSSSVHQPPWGKVTTHRTPSRPHHWNWLLLPSGVVQVFRVWETQHGYRWSTTGPHLTYTEIRIWHVPTQT